MDFSKLSETPSRVASLIDGLSRDAAAVKPSPGEWALVEHLCHLRDIEAEGYAVRIAQLVNENEPLLRDLDGDQLAINRRYIEDDPADALKAFADARARSVMLLESASDFTREGDFENHGRVSLARLVEMMHEHDEGHLRAMTALAERVRR